MADFLSPHFLKRFQLLLFSNKTVTFVAIYPKQLFIVSCPTFLFSKRVRSLVELWIYFNCGKCLAVKSGFTLRNVSGAFEKRVPARGTDCSYSSLSFKKPVEKFNSCPEISLFDR